MSERILEKIEERYKRGEISRETYEAIVKEYRDLEQDDEEREEEQTDVPKGGVGISGIGKTGDVKGEYLRISGSGKIEGDVNVTELSVSGSAKIAGSVKTKKMGCSGACSIQGDIEASSMSVSGSMKCEGDVKADHIEFSGGVRVSGDILTETLDSSGGTKVEGKIIAKKSVKMHGSLKASAIHTELFDGAGKLSVDETLKAVEFNMELESGASSEVESIYAEKIRIKAGSRRGMFSRVFGKIEGGGLIKAGEIRGKDIEMENTNADLVEGDKVNIGPGCRIKVLRAKNATVHESSKVMKRE